MKGLLFVGAFVLLGVGLFAGVLWFGAVNSSGDHAGMTRQVRGTVTESAFEDNYEYSRHRGYRVTYRYEVEGQWYGSDEWIPERTWEPNRAMPVTICVDPEDAARHVVATRPDAQCGDSTVGGAEIQSADPTSAPPG